MQYGFGAWETKTTTLLTKRSCNDVKACEMKLIRFCCESMLKEREVEVQRLTALKEANPTDSVIARKLRDENGYVLIVCYFINLFRRYREDKKLAEDVELALELVHISKQF